MKKIILFIVFSLLGSKAFCLGQGMSEDPGQNYCSSSIVEAGVGNDLYDVGFLSSVIIQLLSGNTSEAADDIGGELVAKVVMLNGQFKSNLCKVNKSTVDRVFPMLRVVAAVNQVTPIPKLRDNKEIQKILAEAVAENPAHYQQLFKRSLQ